MPDPVLAFPLPTAYCLLPTAYLALGYIDITSGLPPPMWGMILAILFGALGMALAVLRAFGRTVWGFLKRYRRGLAALALVLAGGIMAMWFVSRPRPPAEGGPRVLLIGLDGLDPQLLEQYLAEGRLPHLARLAHEGLYHRLATTTPPQSPVAWASFLTGTDPAEHGVFDFIRRDPQRYLPDLALADRRTMRLPWRGRPFWEAEALAPFGITAQRVPLTFPPPRVPGRLLAGMGVWDARGTEGTYFFYATRPLAEPDARGMLFPLRRDGNVWKGEIPGPYFFGQADNVREPFELETGPAQGVLRVQGRTYPLHAGRWSDWVRLEFRRGPLGFPKMKVITRVLWQTRDQQTSLYVSPLNFDPTEPPYALSWPKGYAAELAEAVGLYHTRGMPFDTQALTDGVLDEAAFLEQCRLLTQESEDMLMHELGRFRGGLLFAYFEGPDVIQHMFWRGIDPEHPLYGRAETARYRQVIPQCYEQCDALVGRARAALGKEGTLVVLSDHGFAPYRRSVHLNSLLRELGWLHLQEGSRSAADFFQGVDWGRTRAYAVGFNSVYLNRAGREGQGVVPPEEAAGLLPQLAAALEQYVDPATGQHPIRKVYVPAGPEGDRPDLIVGYARGYRVSWQTALGQVPAAVVEVNGKKWSGDHCIDPQEVPGVFLSSDPALDAQALPGVGAALAEYFQARAAK